MNATATNIAEAIEALDRAENASAASMRSATLAQMELAKARAFLDQLGGMFRSVKETESTASTPVRVRVREKQTEIAVVAPEFPDTLSGRVQRIFEEEAKPLRPRDVVRLYQDRGWPLPEAGSAYNGINGIVAYLYKRKGVLGKNNKFYYLKPEPLSTNGGTTE